MIKQPEALRLADALERGTYLLYLERDNTAAELRRLHEVNQELIAALEFCAGTSYVTDAHEIAEAAIVKAKGDENEQAS